VSLSVDVSAEEILSESFRQAVLAMTSDQRAEVLCYLAEQAARGRGEEAARVETVWVDARTPEEALFSLLDGRQVYDSRQVAKNVTGRDAVKVKILAFPRRCTT